MKPLTEIKKGCGCTFIERDSQEFKLMCGSELDGLCPTCHTLLEQTQEFEKMIKKLKVKVIVNGNLTKEFYINYEELLKEVQGEEK